jgi:hypothetical protein
VLRNVFTVFCTVFEQQKESKIGGASWEQRKNLVQHSWQKSDLNE